MSKKMLNEWQRSDTACCGIRSGPTGFDKVHLSKYLGKNPKICTNLFDLPIMCPKGGNSIDPDQTAS